MRPAQRAYPVSPTGMRRKRTTRNAKRERWYRFGRASSVAPCGALCGYGGARGPDGLIQIWPTIYWNWNVRWTEPTEFMWMSSYTCAVCGSGALSVWVFVCVYCLYIYTQAAEQINNCFMNIYCLFSYRIIDMYLIYILNIVNAYWPWTNVLWLDMDWLNSYWIMLMWFVLFVDSPIVVGKNNN